MVNTPVEAILAVVAPDIIPMMALATTATLAGPPLTWPKRAEEAQGKFDEEVSSAGSEHELAEYNKHNNYGGSNSKGYAVDARVLIGEGTCYVYNLDIMDMEGSGEMIAKQHMGEKHQGHQRHSQTEGSSSGFQHGENRNEAKHYFKGVKILVGIPVSIVRPGKKVVQSGD
jgi:hypothetical protein